MSVIGTDLSVWQSDVDFATMKAAGAEYVICRAAYALAPDARFPEYWQAAKAAGLLRGAYHYMTWDRDLVSQANLFVQTLKADPGELPVVVDFEMQKGAPANASTKLRQFCDIIEAGLGRVPMIYTGPYFWLEHGSEDASWKHYPLWIANYGVDHPQVPAPWADYAFWQYTDRGDGHKYGVSSEQIDLDLFNGNMDDLRKLAGLGDVPPVTEPTDAEKLDVLWAEYVKEHPAATINFPAVANG